MIRSFLLGGTAALVLASSPAAAADQVRFRGTVTLTSVQNCIARYVGETFNSTFRPANVAANGSITSLTTLNQYSGDVYELPNKQFTPKQFDNVTAWGLDHLHYTFNARIMISAQTPLKVDATTPYVIMYGTVENFGADPGSGGTCVVTFRAAYIRRVE